MTFARWLGVMAGPLVLFVVTPVLAALACPSGPQGRPGAILPPKVIAQPTVAMVVRPPSVGADRRVLPLIVPLLTRGTADPACSGARRPDGAASAEAARRRPSERPKQDASPRPR